MKTILVMSGGGAKGMLEAQILKILEQYGKLKNIDLIIGSSVGAINGSILASGKLTATEMCDMYPDMLRYIFKKKLIPIPPLYDRKRFYDIWNDKIGNIKMKEVKTPLIISTIDFCSKDPHFFKSYKQDDGNEVLSEVIARSFAAPMFLGFLPDNKTKRVYGDGGMGEDNLPITESILESLNFDWFNEELKFIAVGTGFVDITEDFNKIYKEGFIRQIYDYIFPKEGGYARAASRTKQIAQLKFLCSKFKNIHFDYYDIEIPEKINGMDKLQYIPEYIEYGKEAAKKPLISL